MRKPIIAGNWKMHMTIPEAKGLVEGIRAGVPQAQDAVEVIVAPPFTALASVAALLRGSKISLAAQNVFWEEKGAYTGEVSPSMVKDAGCTHVIVGHSERRQYFGETDETVNRRVQAALKAGLVPIVCIGETLEERKSGATFTVLEKQLSGGLQGVDMATVIIAYEPVWAIGTGMKATDEQANEAHAFIREWIAGRFGAPVASACRILYGGSVKPESIDGLMEQPEVDGALVGGASLQAESFNRLVNFRAS